MSDTIENKAVKLSDLTSVTQLIKDYTDEKDTNKVDKIEGKSLLDDTEIERLKGVNNYDDTEVKENIAEVKDSVANLSSQIDEIRSKIITNISAVEGNLQLTTDSYQVVSLSSDTTLVLPNVTKPLDIIIEIKPSADITLTYPSNVRWQGDKPSIISSNIYEIYLGFDGTDWIGGWIVYEPVS